MRRARLISFCFLIATIPAQLIAQWQVTGDAGVAHLRQTNLPESNSTTLGINAEAFGDHAWFRSSLLGACASSLCTGQGVAVGSILGPEQRRARWELSGSLSAFSEANGGSTRSGELMGRVQVGRPTFGGAVGAGAGAVNNGGGTGPLYHAQADVWRIVNDDQFVADASLVDRRGSQGNADVLAPSVSYADLSGTWRHERGGLSFGAVLGVRAGHSVTGGGSGWGSVDATAWLSPRVALVASAGRALEDVTRGVPQTRYVSLAIRVAVQPHLSLRSSGSPSRGPTVMASRQRIEIHADDASTVELMGDFTDWSPVALSRDGNVWRLERSLSSGLHRITLRIDGGEWTTPANLPRTTDDLGGSVGLMTVP